MEKNGEDRFLIYYDGKKWYARAVRAAVYNCNNDEMHYKCDMPIGIDYNTFEQVIADLPSIEEKAKQAAIERIKKFEKV